MRCPFCFLEDTKVLDSRPSDEGTSIRRRRECQSCQKRFTTFETVETTPIIVVKKDGSRQQFSREKILKGMIRACEKRPVPFERLEQAAREIEAAIQNGMQHEVASSLVGEYAMDKLKEIDEVAYVRFASVYRQFKDINTLMDEVSKLLKK